MAEPVHAEVSRKRGTRSTEIEESLFEDDGAGRPES
jgi:hypothetical protein